MRSISSLPVLAVAACTPVFSPNLDSVGTDASGSSGSGTTAATGGTQTSGSTVATAGTGTASTAGSTATGSTTGGACSGGMMELCGGVCVDTGIDEAHCGGCGKTCAQDEFCLAGTCTLPRRVLSVALGAAHTCAIVEDGGGTTTLHCWGANDKGQLGLETPETSMGDTPETVPSNLPPVPLPGVPLAVAAGSFHTCALVVPEGRSNNAIYCWGANERGQLGKNKGTNTGTAPGDIMGAMVDDLGTDYPSAVACGREHCCAITSSGTGVRCWGGNDAGQVDPNVPGTDVNDVGPTIGIALPQNETILSVDGIVAGATHSCAHGRTGAMKPWLACWGNNNEGQLGLGNNDPVSGEAPVLELGDYDVIRNLAAGDHHTCVQGLDTDTANAPWHTICWGQNGSGQLGDGSTADSNGPPGTSTPVDFAGGDAPDWLSAGESGTCASASNAARGWCWGRNDNGQVGSGTGTASYQAPSELLDLTSVDTVHTGGRHACLITSTGRLRCWGLNDNGQLGYGDEVNRGGTPETVPSKLDDLVL